MGDYLTKDTELKQSLLKIAYYFVHTEHFQELREQAAGLSWGRTVTTGTGLTLVAYMSHKGFGAPLPSLSAIREMREECLTALLLKEEVELFLINTGIRRARPLALPAPPLVAPPASPSPDSPPVALVLLLVGVLTLTAWVLLKRRAGSAAVSLPRLAVAHSPVPSVPTVAELIQMVTAATAAWHAAIRAKQQGPAVDGKTKDEVGKAKSTARLVVTLTRDDAREAWAALIDRVGPIADYIGEDARVLLPLRLAYVSLCLLFLNNRESVVGRVSEQRNMARAWVTALLHERPALLQAYTKGQHGALCDGCGCPGELCGCELLVGAKHHEISEAFTTLIDTEA